MLKNRLAKLLACLVALAITLNQACYNARTVPVSKMGSEVKNRVEVSTKDGRTLKLVRYRITETQVEGWDAKGQYHEEPIENAQSVKAFKLNVGRTVISSLILTTYALFLLLYYGAQGVHLN